MHRAIAITIVLAVAFSLAVSGESRMASGGRSAAPTPLNVGYIGNPITEYRTDADGNGLFDALVLRVPFVVNETGHLYFRADLVANGTSAWNFTELVVSPGTHAIDLALPGWQIRLSRMDGPYSVDLSMYNAATGNATNRTYHTAAYAWTSFEFLAELQDRLSDRPVDADGDGLYNYLEIRGILNVTKAQIYDLRADLYAPGGTWSYAYALNHTYWAAGASQYVLRFSGDQIRQSGVNGPYRVEVRLGHEYSYWWQTEAFVTGSYAASQFYHQPVVFSGNLTDSGVDLDGNGLFDVIRIGIPITVTVGGVYRISGTLSDSRSNSWSAFLDLTLTRSDVNTTLDFDAFLLKSTLLDSAYSLDLYIFEFASVYYIHATYATGVYTWRTLDNPYANWMPDLRVKTIDANGDGLFDDLQLNATFFAKRAATFVVRFDANLGYCGYLCSLEVETSVTGGPGLITVQTSFAGWRVRAAASNGTYAFYVTLFADTNFLEQEAADANFTYDQFSPALVLRGPIAYRTVDNDGDGLVNQLVAVVPLRVLHSGAFTFNTAVYNTSSYVAVYATRQRYLEPGDLDLDFALSGLGLRQLGANVSLFFSASLLWGFSTFDVLTLRERPAILDPAIFQTAPAKNVTFTASPLPPNAYGGYLRLVNYSNALVVDLRLDSRGQAAATIPDLSYVGAAVVSGPQDSYTWIGRLPAPLPVNVPVNVSRTRSATGEFLDVDLVDWSSGHAWLNRTLLGDPFSRLNADLAYEPDGILTSDEIRNTFKFISLGVTFGVNLRVDNSTVKVSPGGSDAGLGAGLVESGDPIALATPWSLALLGSSSGWHRLVVNLTAGNSYYNPSARVRVPMGWNVTNATVPTGVVISGVGTSDVRILVTENRTVPSDVVLTVQPGSGAGSLRGRISGRVLGAGGAPLAAAHVAAVRGGVEIANVTTGPDGVFTLSALAGGTYEIRVGAEGYVARTWTVSLAEAETLGLGDLPLVALSSTTGVVLGRIRDESGAAIVDVSVNLIHDGTPTAQTQSIADGLFRFDGVPSGTYSLRVTATGFVSRDLPVNVVARQTTDLGQIVLSRASQEVGAGGLGSWLFPAAMGIAIAGIVASVVWVWRRRSGSKPPRTV